MLDVLDVIFCHYHSPIPFGIVYIVQARFALLQYVNYLQTSKLFFQIRLIKMKKKAAHICYSNCIYIPTMKGSTIFLAILRDDELNTILLNRCSIKLLYY